MFCGRVLACLWLLTGVACPAGAAALPQDESFEVGWRSERTEYPAFDFGADEGWSMRVTVIVPC